MTVIQFLALKVSLFASQQACPRSSIFIGSTLLKIKMLYKFLYKHNELPFKTKKKGKTGLRYTLEPLWTCKWKVYKILKKFTNRNGRMFQWILPGTNKSSLDFRNSASPFVNFTIIFIPFKPIFPDAQVVVDNDKNICAKV